MQRKDKTTDNGEQDAQTTALYGNIKGVWDCVMDGNVHVENQKVAHRPIETNNLLTYMVEAINRE